MITLEQAKNLGLVYKRFIESELTVSEDKDICMEFLSMLTEKELVYEALIQLKIHRKSNARCDINHSPEECFIPRVLDAVECITQDFTESNKLVKKTRYILGYYLSISATGSIVFDYEMSL